MHAKAMSRILDDVVDYVRDNLRWRHHTGTSAAVRCHRLDCVVLDGATSAQLEIAKMRAKIALISAHSRFKEAEQRKVAARVGNGFATNSKDFCHFECII